MKSIIGLALIAASLSASFYTINAQAGDANEHVIEVGWIRADDTKCLWYMRLMIDGMESILKIPGEVTCKPNLKISWEKSVNQDGLKL